MTAMGEVSLVDMPGPVTTGSAARVGLVRLVAVLAFVAGLALVQGSLCAEGPAWSGVCPAPSDSVSRVVVDVPAEPEVLVATVPDRPGDRGGVLGVCLMVLVAVLFAVVAFRRPELCADRLVWVSARWTRRTHCPVPRLDQLCVSRT